MNPYLKSIIYRNIAAFGVIVAVLWLAFELGKWATKKRLEPILAKVNFAEQYFDLRRDFAKFNISRALVVPGHETRSCLKGETFFEFVKVSHTTNFTISSGLEERQYNKPVNIAYRLFDLSPERQQLHESGRTFIAGSLAPYNHFPQYATRKIAIPIHCPDSEGVISIQAVQEGNAWQQDVAKPEQWVSFRVKPIEISSEAPPSKRALQPGTKIKWQKIAALGGDMVALKGSYRLATQILANTAEIVPRENGSVLSFAAGSQYPMVWTRDMATIQRALRFWRPRIDLQLANWTEIFWQNQMDDGQIPDWVTPFGLIDGKKTDKNDVQSDQELWTIVGLFEAVQFGLRSKGWLKMHLTGASSALNWLLRNRWNDELGCLWSGHVADWGDVGLQGKDSHSSTKLTAGAPYVCGIFQQALLYQSLKYFNRHAPKTLADTEAVKKLGGVAAILKSIKTFSRQRLWDNEREYFRIHLHVGEGAAHPTTDEDAIFALGGNLLAMESGLANRAERKSIIQTTLKRQKAENFPTIGFVLLPPYKAGTFENEIMDEEYEYQNGGDWDWFSTRMAYQIFRDSPQQGVKALNQIAQKNLALGGFFEWTRKDGTVGAGKNFRAGAAAYIEAIHSMGR